MRFTRHWPVVLAITMACGCSSGPKMTVVKGKLTNAGKSVLPNPKDGLTMVFTPVEAGGTTYPAPLNAADDTYAVFGPDGKSGIPLGKYRVSLNIMTIHSSPAVQKFNEQYSTEKTPIEVEVTGPDLDVDLAKYKPK